MVLTSGLMLTGFHRLEAVCRPLSADFARCYWVIDDQSGPFDFVWTNGSPENEALIDHQFLDVRECDNTSMTCWRPGSLPKLAGHVVVDEWTYFFAIDALEQEAYDRASRIAKQIGDLSGEFLAGLDGLADLVMFHADGWWEFYSFRSDWHERLRIGLPECTERSWKRAGETPA